jgi:hypothetical protein
MLGWPNMDDNLTLGSVKADSGTTIEMLGYQSGLFNLNKKKMG